MKKTLTTLVLAVLLLLNAAPKAEANQWPMWGKYSPDCKAIHGNLGLGSQSKEVHQLQIILNKDIDTQVATSGVGSRGIETNYFGPATLRAVVKFQEKYSIDILTPAGLTQGNGFVGALTRAKISALCGVTQNQTPTITSINPTSGAVGTTVTITGTGFVTDSNIIRSNDVNIDGWRAATHVNTTSSSSLTFTIPSALSADCGPGQMCIQIAKVLGGGVHTITVKNNNGTSNGVSFVVLGPGDGDHGDTQLGTTTNITLIAPKGGETFVRGSTTTITWLTPNVTYIQAPRFNVYAEYVPTMPSCYYTAPRCLPAIMVVKPFTIAQNVIGSAGTSTFSWTIGSTTEADRMMTDGQYQFKVCFAGDQICDSEVATSTLVTR